MQSFGRRCGERTRRRTGCLTSADGTVAADVAPADPGSIVDGATDGSLGISIAVGLTL